MTSPSLYWYSSTLFSILWSCLLLDLFDVSHGDAVTYCDINFFNFWTFLRNCDTGAIQSKTSQEVIRSDVSSHVESDMDICLKKKRTICWAGALGGIARAELPSPLEQKKGLARPHGRTRTRYHTFGSDFYWLCQTGWHMLTFWKFFWWLKFLGEKGVGYEMRADSKTCLALQSISNSSHALSLYHTNSTWFLFVLLYSDPSTMVPTFNVSHLKVILREKRIEKIAIHRNVRFCCLKQPATAAWSPWMNGATSNEASWVPSDGPGVWPNPPRRHGIRKCAPFRKISEYV